MATTIKPKSDAPSSEEKGSRSFSSKPRSSQQDIVFNYKRPDILRQYMTETGRVVPSRVNRLTSKQQRDLTREIKKARMLALLPFSDQHYKS